MSNTQSLVVVLIIFIILKVTPAKSLTGHLTTCQEAVYSLEGKDNLKDRCLARVHILIPYGL